MADRSINAYSPSAEVEITTQVMEVQIGTNGVSRLVEETFAFDPVAHASGIPLSYPASTGTLPAVFLAGLRLLTRPSAGSSEGDVAVVTTINPGTLEAETALVFVGSTYSVASGDIVHVKYWTPEV